MDTARVDWDGVFGDLEAEFDAAAVDELAGEVADRTRRERATVSLHQRLAAAVGPVTVTSLGGVATRGTPIDVGPDWLLLALDDGGEALVAIHAVLSLTGLGAAAAPEPEPSSGAAVVARRMTLAYALRGLARDRAVVVLSLVDGTRVTGTIDRVGADHCDLAEHDPAELRRAASVRAVRTVPTAALSVVTRR